MAFAASPLRYPGGKAKLYDYVRELLVCNDLLGETYIEPFAGGAGLALRLLLADDVKRIVINDLDPAIYSFWYCVLNDTDNLCRLIRDTPVTPEQWAIEKQLYMDGLHDNRLEYAFATFYLNRTNVSGVLMGGIIGGAEQSGNYSIDARYNADDLVGRIERIAKKKSDIILTNLDAVDFLGTNNLRHYYKVFINLDPPYVKKGKQLYKNAFSAEDHRVLSEKVKNCKRKWIVTYDICDLVDRLYIDYRSSYLDVNYSIRGNKKAREFIFFSNDLALPQEVKLRDR